MITEEGDARLGDFGIRGIITDSTVAERGGVTDFESGVTRYLAPELLNPQFGLPDSNPSKESDVYSFAMTAYEVFSSYLVTCVTNKCLLPMNRSSLGPSRTIRGRRAPSPLMLDPRTTPPAQATQRQTVGYRTQSGTSLSAAGTGIHGSGCPLVYYVERSLDRIWNRKRIPRSLGVVEVSLTWCDSSYLKPIFGYSNNPSLRYKRCTA